MTNLIPTQRKDKNGHIVTRHVRVDKIPSGSTRLENFAGITSSSFANSDAYEPQTQAEFAISPTEEDYKKAVETEAVNISITSGSLKDWDRDIWKSVMGEGTRQTEASSAAFLDKQRERVLSSPELMENVEKYALGLAESDSYARAYEAGVEPRQDKIGFLRISYGEMPGNSEAQLRKRLNDMRDMRDGVIDGTIAPSSIHGGGYRDNKESALKWIDQELKERKRDIETGGRSNRANIDSFKAWKNAMIRDDE